MTKTNINNNMLSKGKGGLRPFARYRSLHNKKGASVFVCGRWRIDVQVLFVCGISFSSITLSLNSLKQNTENVPHKRDNSSFGKSILRVNIFPFCVFFSSNFVVVLI